MKVSGAEELEAAFAQMSKERIEAVIVQPSLQPNVLPSSR
jgi:hypothetical protein